MPGAGSERIAWSGPSPHERLIHIKPPELRRRSKLGNELAATLDERRFHGDLVEAGGVRGPQAGGVGVIRESEQRDLRIRVGDVVRIDAGNVRDHDVGRIDAVDRLEAMLRQERLELSPQEQLDPTQQNRGHA